jgi:serine/threonine protein kinase
MGDERPRTRYCGRCLTTFQADPEVCPNLPCRAARPAEGWGVIFEAGEIIDRHYRVRRRLATGGAGVTYLATEIEPETEAETCDMAVKVLWATRDHGSYLRRLSQEAQILQELAHPHIVEYRGFVHRTGHAPYLVTRFEHGGSLYDHVRRRQRLGLRESASIGRQVLEALGRAHLAGVIHRDLKPENVLLQTIPEPGQPPHVLVADFGIAKVQGLFSDGLTRVGAFVGTPQYAAPEQFDGLPPAPATDVFACGALLYFCLQGQPLLPLANRLPPEDARELLLGKLPPKLVLPDEKPEQVKAVEQVLEASMAPEAGERITVREMHSMLEAIEHGSFLVRPTSTAIPARSKTTETNIFLFSSDGIDEEEPPPPPPPEEQPPPPPPREPVDQPLATKPAAPPAPSGRPEPEPEPQHAPTDHSPPSPVYDEPPEPPRKKGFSLPLMALGAMLLVGLCGGGGVAGLLMFRPDLLAGVPGLESLTGGTGSGGTSGSGDALERAVQSQLDRLTTQGIMQCGIHARVSMDVTVTPAGAIQPTPPSALPPKKARCLGTHLEGFTIQPAPGRELKLKVSVPG